MDEREWYERAFRGQDAAQLTVRAVVMGCVLGFFLAFTNVYVGLKTGWGLGVALTACIASFSIWSALLRVGLARTPMTILENNCMQSTASSAGVATTLAARLRGPGDAPALGDRREPARHADAVVRRRRVGPASRRSACSWPSR